MDILMRLSKSDQIFLPFLAIENHVIRISFFFSHAPLLAKYQVERPVLMT